MTNEEAIAYGEDYLKDLITACCHIEEKHKEFVRMALEALKQPTEGIYITHKVYSDLCLRAAKAGDLERELAALKAEPCGDAVRRETVRDMFCEIHCHNERSKCAFRNICKYMNHVSALPPVTPKQRTGKWIEVDTNMYSCNSCSHCFTIVPEDNNISQFKLCPHCGAKMEGEKE